MLAGQVGLVRHSESWIGKTVEWATDSTSHHVVIAISEHLCVSADLPRVIIRPISEFHSMEWSQFVLTHEQVEAITDSALGMIGRPYNVPAIVLLLLSRLTRVPIPKFAVRWLERNPGLDCSQLCAIALRAGGIVLFPHEDALVVPAHFEECFREQGWLDPNLLDSYFTGAK